MTSDIRKLSDRHIEAWHAFQRAPKGEASRKAENALPEPANDGKRA